jgi:hypothetical protein
MKRSTLAWAATVVACMSLIAVVFSFRQTLFEISEQHCLVMDCRARFRDQRDNVPFVELAKGNGCCMVICETSLLEDQFDGHKFLLVAYLESNPKEGDTFEIRSTQQLQGSDKPNSTESTHLAINSFIAMRGKPRTMECAIDHGQIGRIEILNSSDDYVNVRVDLTLHWEDGGVDKLQRNFALRRTSYTSRVAELPSKDKLQRKFQLGPFNVVTFDKSRTAVE